jgi:hypothetical protein
MSLAGWSSTPNWEYLAHISLKIKIHERNTLQSLRGVDYVVSYDEGPAHD